MSVLGKANADLGLLDDAWRCIDEAMATVGATGEKWHGAEIHRTTGEIALMSSKPDVANAQGHFERALQIARAQKARFWELRAATSIARLWRDQGKHAQARGLLAPIHDWFTEGFDTSDLKDAKMLFGELS
jgi:predicted ATPase